MERRHWVLFAASGALMGALLAVILLLFWNLPESRAPLSRDPHKYNDQSSAPRGTEKSLRSATEQRLGEANAKGDDRGQSPNGGQSQNAGKTVSGGSDGNRPNSPKGSSSGADKPNPPDAESGGSGLGAGNRAAADAVREAEKLRDQARRLAEKDQYGKAYEAALEAWRKVQTLAGMDPACQRLEAELRGLLEKYGEAANRKYVEVPFHDGKPLVTK